MISINSGKLIIPEEDRFIGFAGDNLHSTKHFLVENTTDSSCIYRLYLKFDDGSVNHFVLDSKVENGSTTLTWNILEEHIFKSGIVNAQIKAISDSGEAYHTSWDYFYVENSAEFSGEFKDNENAEFLRYEKELNEIYAKITGTDLSSYVTTDRTIAGLSLADDITAEELCSALSVYPTILKEGAPTVFDGYVGRFLVDTVNCDLYYCDQRTLSGSNWIKLTDSSSSASTDSKSLIKAQINSDGELLLTYSDDTTENLGVVVGKNGTDGNDGVGISSIEQSLQSSEDNGTNTLEINLTNGTSTTFTVLNGSKGDKGEIGDTGPQGPQGESGVDGYTPIKGVDYFTDCDKEEIVESVVDKTGLLETINYNTTTNNLSDEVYEYGYLNSTGDNQDSYTPISVSMRTSNFIPVEGGKVLCFNSPYGNGTTINICQYNSNKECIVERTEIQTEIHKWSNNGITLNDQTRYIRFAVYKEFEDLTAVQINLYYYENQADMWDSTGAVFNYVPHHISEYIGDFVPTQKIASPLTGKKIVYDGDSICESRTGSTANNGGAYAKLIADTVFGKYENFAQGGARLTSKSNDETYHSVVDNLSNLPTDGDLYCFEGGINDYWTPKELGSFSKTDFTGELDTSTVCGALETIFRYALNTFVGKPVCFVITHKIQSTAYAENTNGDTFEDYRNAMIGICEKYSIPYYDAFSKSGLNGWNNVQNSTFLTSNSEGTPDGCHPNEEGYKRYYVPQLISLFESIITN